jgi:hypothetical protein
MSRQFATDPMIIFFLRSQTLRREVYSTINTKVLHIPTRLVQVIKAIVYSTCLLIFFHLISHIRISYTDASHQLGGTILLVVHAI